MLLVGTRSRPGGLAADGEELNFCFPGPDPEDPPQPPVDDSTTKDDGDDDGEGGTGNASTNSNGEKESSDSEADKCEVPVKSHCRSLPKKTRGQSKAGGKRRRG